MNKSSMHLAPRQKPLIHASAGKGKGSSWPTLTATRSSCFLKKGKAKGTSNGKGNATGRDVAKVKEQSAQQVVAELVGCTYEVKREGQSETFTLAFEKDGRLIVNLGGQLIDEIWQASETKWGGKVIIAIGGRGMPSASVVGSNRSLFGSFTDLTELWEPSPPMGAPPLTGTRQQRSQILARLATKLELIVDRSGSMSPLHAATVEGLNRFLRDQRCLPHASAITMRLVTFDDKVETPWQEGTPLSDLSRTVNPSMVQPRGMTALLDAIGTTLRCTPLAPPRVVCIVTDGMENSSLEYTREQVNDLITARKTAGWTFIFLAANQDAIAVGSTLGISAGTCATFSATPAGIAGGFGSASASSYRGAAFGSGAAVFSSSERARCMSR